MFKQYLSNRTKRLQNVTVVLTVLIVAATGTYVLTRSHAATPYVSVNAANGTLSGSAQQVQNCSGASNGSSCVVFGGTTSSSPVILGADVDGGQGATMAGIFVRAGITWDRKEFSMPSMTSNFGSPAQDASYGLSTIAIINTGDSTPLSSINATAYANYGLSLIQANPSIKLWEVLNEAYYKGGVADPQNYGKLYLALYNAVKSSGISGVKLMFNMWGDYQLPSGGFSDDCCGGGWLHDAVAANPGLAAAIANEAFSSHPYGPINANNQDESGTGALAGYGTDNLGWSQEKEAQTVLGTIPPFYITEFGYQLPEVNSKYSTPCSTTQGGQAYLLTQAYNIFLTDPHIKGIWWYEAYDANFGLLNSDYSARPSFNALVNELDLQQHSPSCNPS